MTEFMRGFLTYVGYFFIVYLIGYASFQFIYVLTGSRGLLYSGFNSRAGPQRGSHGGGHGAFAAGT